MAEGVGNAPTSAMPILFSGQVQPAYICLPSVKSILQFPSGILSVHVGFRHVRLAQTEGASDCLRKISGKSEPGDQGINHVFKCRKDLERGCECIDLHV